MAGKSEPIKTIREQILAFRLQSQNLARRLPSEALLKVAGACGIRNSPPGSAELSLHARLEGFSTQQLKQALSDDKTLVEAWSLRVSPVYFPASDLATFTLGTLPQDEEAVQAYMQPSLPTIKQAGMSATEALEIVTQAMLKVLDGRTLNKGELSTAVSQNVPEKLRYWCKGCQAYHVSESLFRVAAQKAQICFKPRTSGEVLFVRSDQWLGISSAQADIAQAQAEILRRYLHSFGPSTPKDFAKWATISPKQAQQSWQSIAEELVEISFGKNRLWLLQADLAAFESPPEAASLTVRLLPPYDSYLLLSDRETLLPDKSQHGEVWRALGNPGVVLAEGEAAGIWRPQKKGRKLVLNVTLFRPLSERSQAQIEIEADSLAPLKGSSSVEVLYTS